MQWSQIKTLFILSFLILNIYLVIQFIDKKDQADYALLDQEESTIEEKLKNENIIIKEELSDVEEQEPYISVEQKMFDKKDLRLFDDFPNQKVSVINNKFVISIFDKPVAIPDESLSTIEEFVKKSFIYPEDYVLWDWNKELNMLVFFQQKDGRPIYFNQGGVILVSLNDENEMTYYTQTMLGKAEPLQDENSLITPKKAIEALYNANELHSKDEITQAVIGYHTRVPLDDGVQVFVPAWKVTVNDKRNYFVNAIEAFVFSSDEANFLKEAIEYNIERVDMMDDDDEHKAEGLKLLTEKLEAINRGGIE